MALVLRPSTKHQCHLCPKSFSRAYHLRSHLDAHQGIQRYCCTICQTLFVRRNDLRAHTIEQHSIDNEKPAFYCRQVDPNGAVRGCGNSFARKSLLARHLRGAKAASCRGVAQVSTSPQAKALSDVIERVRQEGIDAMDDEKAAGICRLPTSHALSSVTCDPSTDYALRHVWVLQENSMRSCELVYNHKDARREDLESNIPVKIQCLRQDSFMDWTAISDLVAVEALRTIAGPDTLYRTCYGRLAWNNPVRWRRVYGNAITLTRRLLSIESWRVYKHMSWLSVLVALSSRFNGVEDSLAHITELRRLASILPPPLRSVFSYHAASFRLTLMYEPRCHCRHPPGSWIGKNEHSSKLHKKAAVAFMICLREDNDSSCSMVAHLFVGLTGEAPDNSELSEMANIYTSVGR